MTSLGVIELCAGAGGQGLGLEVAGFEHSLAIELDKQAVQTLLANRDWDVRCGDVADATVWEPADHTGVDLLAGGVPCPPFSIAGKQLGATDERDLFAWAVELVATIEPRAVLLENVRGLAGPRFAGYRQHVRDRLEELGYWSDWRLLNASDFGVPQLRPRFVLVALRTELSGGFSWPVASPAITSVGKTLLDLMSAKGWEGAESWALRANDIAPTIVGGSKKHGGADLGPTRAKRAWRELGVDGLGVADEAPPSGTPVGFLPKLTTEMVARIQGWNTLPEFEWTFTGRKTSRYRQIGNAFPPPVARAVGLAIRDALLLPVRDSGVAEPQRVVHDPLYRALRSADRPLTLSELTTVAEGAADSSSVCKQIDFLLRDFDIETSFVEGEAAYQLRGFRGFTGQAGHVRHELFAQTRSRIS